MVEKHPKKHLKKHLKFADFCGKRPLRKIGEKGGKLREKTQKCLSQRKSCGNTTKKHINLQLSAENALFSGKIAEQGRQGVFQAKCFERVLLNDT